MMFWMVGLATQVRSRRLPQAHRPVERHKENRLSGARFPIFPVPEYSECRRRNWFCAHVSSRRASLDVVFN